MAEMRPENNAPNRGRASGLLRPVRRKGSSGKSAPAASGRRFGPSLRRYAAAAILVIGLLATAAAAASHSGRARRIRVPVKVSGVSSPPASATPSGSVVVSTRVQNTLRRRSKRQRFSLYLEPVPPWGGPATVVARGTVRPLRPRRSRRFTVRASVPSTTPTARYRLVLCLGRANPTRRALHDRACARSRGATVVVSVAPGPWIGQTAQGRDIEGYTSEVSALPGGTVEFHVSTAPDAEPYRIDIFRAGWYDGRGAEGMTCVPGCNSQSAGVPRPMPSPDPATGKIVAGWPVTDRLAIPTNWSSGVYLARFVLTGGPNAGKGTITPFVIRAPAGRSKAILVDVPVNTWQAYNSWGGKSLYPASSTNRVPAVIASFDRPYAGIVNRWPTFYDTLLFLEREGYDVAYTTDVDVDREPASLRDHPLVIVAGHSEYWTSTMRTAFEAARDAGVNLGFFGGNIGYWQSRYADAGRTIVEYRSATKDPEPDPALKTVQFRKLTPPRPECELLGVEFQGADSSHGEHNLAVLPSGVSDSWFAGTGFTTHSVLKGLASLEWDSITKGCSTPRLTEFFRYAGPPYPADVVRYTAPSGARVLSLSSLGLPWGLSEPPGRSYYANGPAGLSDPRLQRFVQNALDAMGGHRG